MKHQQEKEKTQKLKTRNKYVELIYKLAHTYLGYVTIQDINSRMLAL